VNAFALSHGLAAVVYLGFAFLIAAGGNRKGPGGWLLAASAATAAWAAAAALGAVFDRPGSFVEAALETVRSAAWIGFLVAVLSSRFSSTTGYDARRLLLWAAGIVSLLILVALCVRAAHLDVPGLTAMVLIGRLAIAILGLVAIENLARNESAAALWAGRHLVAGVGGLLAFDLFLFSEALLFRRINPDLLAARGAVDAIAAPLMALAVARNPAWTVDIHVSRRFVFHSMTLVGTGLYLLAMALVGFYLRSIGGAWGTLLQVVFLSIALVTVFLTVSSAGFRARIRLFISRNFFSNRYDWREEWLRFTGTVAAQGSMLPLHDRVIQTIANLVDSPAGSLWMRDALEEKLDNTAAWNMPLSRETRPIDARLTEWFEQTGLPAALQLDAIESSVPAAPAMPAWVAEVPRAWLGIPLLHRDRLLAFLLLATPNAPRRLSVEDFDLLATAARQAASYLAEEETGKSLADARQLEAFNRRFAFLVHDIKNIASQLSLILKNAERFGDNPEFQKDLIETVRHSVGRMSGLLEQMGAEKRKGANPTTFDVTALARREWGERHPARERIRVSGDACIVAADEEQVHRVLQHVVQNAVDAVGTRGAVEIRVAGERDFAVIEVVDNGPGMTAEFIRDQLFRPFESTKKAGYGIGAYQARQLARELGGRLDVTSEPGVGTTVRVVLPLARERAEPPEKQHA
jgi:putative PEP-CTERM system histidine kinase